MTDRELADILTRTKCYGSTVGVIDKGKVALAKAGIRRPSAKDALAFVAQELYLRERPPPVPAPSPLAPIFQQDAVYVNVVTNFPDVRALPALGAGFTVAYVQLLHTVWAADNEAHLPILRSEGFHVGGWGTYGQDTDPHQDGLAAAAICKRLGLKCWKANGEGWAEWEESWKTEAFLLGWREGGAPCPLGWSVLSSDTANHPRAFAYDVALAAPGADIDIQVYGATYPTYTVGAGLGMLSKTSVPVNRTTMTFDITAAGKGPFGDYRTWQGPRRVWIGEWSTADTWKALAR